MANQLLELKGVSACRGKAKGKIKIIQDPMKPPVVKDGQILVMPFSIPLLTPILSRAKGLIVNSGGLSSHTAIIAREFNIPCIMGVKNATQILKNDQNIILDADKGIVYAK